MDWPPDSALTIGPRALIKMIPSSVPLLPPGEVGFTHFFFSASHFQGVPFSSHFSLSLLPQLTKLVVAIANIRIIKVLMFSPL